MVVIRGGAGTDQRDRGWLGIFEERALEGRMYDFLQGIQRGWIFLRDCVA